MDARFEFLCRLGDNALILGHRLSEWCGKGPALEEDIALANTALDLIGQAQLWLGLAAEVEGAGRDADRLAYFRDPHEFRCALLVEQPNTDFAHTMMRQALFDSYHLLLLRQLAEGSGDAHIAEIAQKAVKEVTYHQERSGDLVIRLGDGTEESHNRMQGALDVLWPFAGELVTVDPVETALAEAGILPDPYALEPAWRDSVTDMLTEATLRLPDSAFAHRGGKTGTRHSEHLGHLLAVMQSLPRSHPDATW